jgi:hypothetical protein
MLSGVVSIPAIPSSSTLWLREQSRVSSLGPGYVVPYPQSVLLTPPTPDAARHDFGFTLYASVDIPPLSPHRVSSTGLFIFCNMPPLLPRKIPTDASVFQSAGLRPSPYVHWVGIFISIYEATYRFTFVTACCFANWELTTPCYQNAAPLNYWSVRTTPQTGL